MADERNYPDGTSGRNFRGQADAAQRSHDKAQRGAGLTWFHILRRDFWAVVSQTDPAKLRSALITLAVTAMDWATAIDRREARRGRP